jgi:hypothetical protein
MSNRTARSNRRRRSTPLKPLTPLIEIAGFTGDNVGLKTLEEVTDHGVGQGLFIAARTVVGRLFAVFDGGAAWGLRQTRKARAER